MQTVYAIQSLSQDHLKQAQTYQNQLTKPAGSVGQLESIATRLAAMQATLKPTIQSPWITVFAADHGVTDMGVSAFPAVVTQEMVKNFSAGGAAITVLAKSLNAGFEVVDVGVINDMSPLPNLVSARVAAGTQNMAVQPAMTLAQCKQAMQAGVQAVHRALEQQADLFIGGDMGIGNTTAATAMIAQL
jgi:nicotinate-nucleotide--dimethylbenzimidazole phosphoribosyltransferase